MSWTTNVPKVLLTPLSYGPSGAACLMGISRARVYQLKNAGELPFYKDGSRTLFRLADIEARIERLKREQEMGGVPKSGPPTGPLLPPEDRTLARKKVRAPEVNSTEPLLPAEQQQIATELASAAEPETLSTSPLHHVDQQLIAIESALERFPRTRPKRGSRRPLGDQQILEPDFARVYAERVKLLATDVDEVEVKARAREFTVRRYRDHHKCDLEIAKAMVSAAIRRGPAPRRS
jgi:excisionase family DNA binding protein